MTTQIRRWAIDLGWHLRAFRRLYLRWRVRRFLRADQHERELARVRPWY